MRNHQQQRFVIIELSHPSFHAGSCANRFQDKSIYDQLVLGVRYFDIQACWVDEYEPKGAWVCYKSAYAGPVKAVLEQIDLWMNEPYNRNEVSIMEYVEIGPSSHYIFY